MAFAITRGLRPLFLMCALSWPLPSAADNPDSPRDERLHGLHLGKRGVEYRNLLQIRDHELPYRIWGGRSIRKRFAIGVDYVPDLPYRRFRVGAYGNLGEVGLAMRWRY